jgi:hypothetical protein
MQIALGLARLSHSSSMNDDTLILRLGLAPNSTGVFNQNWRKPTVDDLAGAALCQVRAVGAPVDVFGDSCSVGPSGHVDDDHLGPEFDGDQIERRMERFPSVSGERDSVRHEADSARWRNNRDVADTEIEEFEHCTAIARGETRGVPGVSRLQGAF